jgi:hypothetical protein
MQNYQQLWRLFQEYAPSSTLQVPRQEHVPSTAILEHGELFVGNTITYKPMAPKACHTNVLALYDSQQIKNMCVGYALAPDRQWRYHSWGLGPSFDIVETTAPFLLYFGCILQEKVD